MTAERKKANVARDPLILSNLRGYEPAWFGNDFSAGLAVAAVGLPSAIAYPAIAGLPAETGLYASIVPLVAYPILGPSV
jgi:sulfate permease, SulP family